MAITKHTCAISAINSFLNGQEDNFPTTVCQVHNILQHCEETTGGITLESEGVAFAQGGAGCDLSHVQCFNCHECGHCTSDCTNAAQDDQQGAQLFIDGNISEEQGAQLINDGEEVTDEVHGQIGFSFLQTSASFQIPKMWVLLDNGSTVNVFCNRDSHSFELN